MFVRLRWPAQNKTALLYLASCCGHGDVLTALVERPETGPAQWSQDVALRWSPGQSRRTMLHAAATSGPSAVDKLLELKADPTRTDWSRRTALHDAAEAGTTAVTSLVVALRTALETQESVADAKTAVDIRDDKDNTPLLLAAAGLHFQGCETLIQLKADVNASNKFGFTPLLAVVDAGDDTKIAQLLISAQADIHAVQSRGQSALHMAAKHSHINCVQTLLRIQADVNQRDMDGNTALHTAVKGTRASNKEVVRALLGAGADILALNDNRANPIHAASSQDTLDELMVDPRCQEGLAAVNIFGQTPEDLATAKGLQIGEFKRQERKLPLQLLKELRTAAPDTGRARTGEETCLSVNSWLICAHRRR